MNIKDLILEVDKEVEFPILVDNIAKILIQNNVRDDIEFVPADMDMQNVKGFIREWETVPAPYSSEGKRMARIYYSDKLNDCWKRYICAKELIHLLDGKFVAVDNPKKLSDLMIGMSTDLGPWLQTMAQGHPDDNPVRVPISAPCLVDYAAEWLAIPVLVPPTAQKKIVDQYSSNKMTAYDVAYLFRIPQKFVPFITSPIYDQFVGLIINPPQI